MTNNEGFLMAVLALGLVCTLQGEEKAGSARWNRTRAAEEAILKICDIYLPEGLDKARLASICAVLDGPVRQAIERHATILFDAVEVVNAK